MAMHNIVLVDDEKNILSAIRRVLERNGGWRVFAFDAPRSALDHMGGTDTSLILSDYRMPGMNGVEFLTEAKVLQPDAIRLILSGYSDLNAVIGAINQAEIYRFVSKPWNDYDLVATLQQALDYRDVLVENKRLADQVRRQNDELERRKSALDEMQSKHPALFDVDWGPDGSIILNDDELA